MRALCTSLTYLCTVRARVDALFCDLGGGPEDDIGPLLFRGALAQLGLDVSDADADAMFEAADTDGGGTLDMDEVAAVGEFLDTPTMTAAQDAMQKARQNQHGGRELLS